MNHPLKLSSHARAPFFLCAMGLAAMGPASGCASSAGDTESPTDAATGGAVGSGATAGSGGQANADTGGAPSAGGNGVSGGTGDHTGGGNTGGSNMSGGNTSDGGQDGGTGGTIASGSGGSNGQPEMLVFLLLGQSNMVGAPQPAAQDQREDARIQVLAYDNCPNLGRTYDEWYPASPPLHNCDGGVGPGDYFAKTLLTNLSPETKIGLVPLAVNGAPLAVFRKGVPRPGWTLPPDDHWPTGYEWIISRAQEAQKVGSISGILFHQGESDQDNADWSSQVAQLVADLRTDLNLGEEVPFVAGEFLETGCCESRNSLVNAFPQQIPHAWVASSDGLAGTDIYHFDLAAQRELGRRYAEQMISALGL